MPRMLVTSTSCWGWQITPDTQSPFRVTWNGEELLYQGMLAKRGDPIREEYIAIEPREVTAAEVDLRMGYDLSTPGSYQVQFTTGLRDVIDDASLVPRKRDDHRPQSLSCSFFRKKKPYLFPQANLYWLSCILRTILEMRV